MHSTTARICTLAPSLFFPLFSPSAHPFVRLESVLPWSPKSKVPATAMCDLHLGRSCYSEINLHFLLTCCDSDSKISARIKPFSVTIWYRMLLCIEMESVCYSCRNGLISNCPIFHLVLARIFVAGFTKQTFSVASCTSFQVKPFVLPYPQFTRRDLRWP